MDEILPIDAGMMVFYKALSAQSPPEAATWPLDQQRAAWNAVCRKFRSPFPDSVTVEDKILNGVPCQIYRPVGDVIKPCMLYFHGGGWVLGGPETHGDICAEIAAGADCIVILVDYRLAPEHSHPAQLEDSLHVLQAVRERHIHGVDYTRVFGGGDSAGGQLTVGLSLYLRDHGHKPLSAMVLIYPVLGNDVNTASYLRNAQAPCLTRDEMIFFLDSFLGPKDNTNWRDPIAAPLLADDLSNLPPAFIAVAAHDPLYDDGLNFHTRLIDAGSMSELRTEPALAHSYMRARHVSEAAKFGFEAIITAIKSLTQI
jgi:acetyl esterase